MPRPFVYKNGQELVLKAKVIDARDASNPVISIGAYHFSIPQLNLDAGDTRTTGRELTDEELDHAQIKKAQQDADAEARRRATEEVDAT